MMTENREGLLTSAEVAATFGVSLATVARWVRLGKLDTARTPGGRNVFRPEDIDAFAVRRAQSSVSRSIVDRLAAELDRDR